MSLLSRLDRVRQKNESTNPDASPEELSTPESAPTSFSSSPASEEGAGLFQPAQISTYNSDVPEEETENEVEALKREGFGRDSGPGAASHFLPADISDDLSNDEISAADSESRESHELADRSREYYAHKYLIFDDVFSSIDPRLLQHPQRDALTTALQNAIEKAARDQQVSPHLGEMQWLLREFSQEILAFGPISPFLDDTSISKISINGSSEVVVERLGQPEGTPIYFRDNDHLLSLIRRVADVVGGRIDNKVPLLDRPLPDGSRVRAKVPPLSPQPTLVIEKKSGNPFEILKRQQAERAHSEVQPYSQLRERIQLRLVRELEGDLLSASNPERLRNQVEEMISGVIQEERVAMSRAERASLAMDLLNEIVGLGPLEPLLNDPEVDEIMVNGPHQIYTERRGKIELTPIRFRDNGHVMQVVDRMVAPLGRRVDEKSPMVDGRLRDGSRFNVVLPPVALSGPTLTIRKFARDPFSMTDLVNFGSLSREAAQFLQAAVHGRLNCVVSGGTGSGKTTTLNVLSGFIPDDERIVTIEDAAELQLRQEHVIRLETRPANIEGAGMIGIRELVRNALRMRPDRIIVGECRGAEALDMLQAMNTGHDGSLTTLHANSPRDMLKRLETMVLMAGFELPVRAIREQISMAIQLVVHQERMKDGVRRVTAITEIYSMEGDAVTMQDIFRFEQDHIDGNGRIHGRLEPSGLRPKYYERILQGGAQLSLELFTPKSFDDPARVDNRKARALRQ
jgi:pilus assembly protein CpaF